LDCWLQVAGDWLQGEGYIYWLPGYFLLVIGLLITRLFGYLLVTGSLRSKGMLRWDCFTGHGVYGSTVGCWLRVTGWWLADWLADWLVNWSPYEFCSYKS
jgi:hypothetical protein